MHLGTEPMDMHGKTIRQSHEPQGASMGQNTLEIKHLSVSFFTDKGEIKAVNDVSLTIPAGKIVGIVGESGCGKSMTARSIMGLIKKPGKITAGEIILDGKNVASMSEKELCSIRGNEVSMIFQEPMTSLNPVMQVGKQVEEALRLHEKVSGAEARKRMLEIFEDVGISEGEKRAKCYPHELSGGLRQRIMIAMAMITKPRLLIADEPTTALDVTVEAQILRLMKRLCDAGTSILLISHNLGVIAQVCDYVYVMYAGRFLEEADIGMLFRDPRHPYTKGLLDAVSSLRESEATLDTIPGVVPNLLHLPEGCSFSLRCEECEERCAGQLPGLTEVESGHWVRCWKETVETGDGVSVGTVLSDTLNSVSDRTVPTDTPSGTPLIEAKNLTKEFPAGHKKKVHAVSDVSLAIYQGETLGIVGESGCGKSTLGRMLIRTLKPTSGELIVKGENVSSFSDKAFQKYRRRLQLIFQDPYASLDPRMTVRDLIAEPLITYKVCKGKEETTKRVLELMADVGVPGEFLYRFPHQFSGGQRQRIGIARALAADPELIVCDEPVSALDVGTGPQILNLLKELQKSRESDLYVYQTMISPSSGISQTGSASCSLGSSANAVKPRRCSSGRCIPIQGS